jgi:FAD/FMN-containing dehydrogenase
MICSMLLAAAWSGSTILLPRAGPHLTAPPANFLKEMRNPCFISENPALTETSGWVDAWNSTPSAYAVKVRSTADVVAAVNFARENKLRLVVKGGGHSYQGTSDAPDSLLIWTREMSRNNPARRFRSD